MTEILRSTLGVYASSRMILLGLLGLSSGLPLLLINSTLSARLKEAGVSTVVIGLFALVNLPYGFKFVWSPLLDRFIPPAPGSLKGSRRRGWMVLTQMLLILGLGWLGFQDPNQVFPWGEGWLGAGDLGIALSRPLFIVAMVVALLGATQDIAVDAYRTDLLEEREMGAGVAIFVMGYRIALLISGGVALILVGDLELSWGVVYGIMAAVMGVGVIASFLAPEPPGYQTGPTNLQQAVIEPFRAFISQQRQFVLILLFIVLYKLADNLAGQMTTPFLLDIGFSVGSLGKIRSGIGLAATLVGSFIGGIGVNRLGIQRALLVFAALQGLSNLGFVSLALQGQNLPLMVGVISVENLTGGMGTTAFLAFLMSLCNKKYSATQYALLTSLFAIGGTLSGSISGYLAQLGWGIFFLVTVACALPGIGLLMVIRPQRTPEPEQDASLAEAS